MDQLLKFLQAYHSLQTQRTRSLAPPLREQLRIWQKGKTGAIGFWRISRSVTPQLVTSSFPVTFRSCVRVGLRSARSCSQNVSMEGNSNAELLDAQEPARKKHAVELSHSNGCNNGDSSLSVKHSLALRVKKLAPEAILPSRGSALAAGYDLSSAYEAIVPARGKALIKTELSIAIPEGTYARVAPRSGLAWKHSIDVGAGVIDADYRGPVGVILFNHSDTEFSIKAGDRIAQLILECIVTPEVVELDDLDATTRGEGGFGSTGIAGAPVLIGGVSTCEATLV